MRIFQLLESNYVDLFSKVLKEFIKDNRQNYNNDEFIFFTENKDTAFSNAFESNSDLGMVCYPKSYFVNNPIIFKNKIKRFFKVVKPVKSMLKINTLTSKAYVNYAKKLGIKEPENVYKEIIKSTNYFKNKSSYGYALFYIIRHKIENGNISQVEDTSTNIKNKFLKLGFKGVYDTSKNISTSILSNQYPCIAYVFNTGVVKTTQSFDTFRNDVLTDEITDETESNRLYKKLASYIAVALDTGLNSDEPYHEGLDHYYWSYDGIQIRITVIFDSSKTTSADDIAYQLDIETPYGVLYTITSPEDTFETIARNIKNRYSKMTTPQSSWKPKDRDVFLVNHTEEFKDNENRIQDLINEVNKYYPHMYEFGMQYNIKLPRSTQYSDFDKTFLSGILERFSNQQSARKFLEKITNDGEDTSLDHIKTFFPRGKLPKKITYEDLKRMALLYDIAKQKRPTVSGWRLFYNIK